ncbi:MAG: hypothetical protein D6B25_02535 [Desulfobulbaceae bacterium]|nr:MAG: hypothetical protein D6B25_02535 [Desulfobulbaceae bacterium]
MRQSGFPITLTTDFGYRDEYVGVMKGVILSINKGIPIVDLVHDVSPQNIRQAAKIIWNNHKYFPDGSVHVGIVDPSVGSSRRILAIQHDTHCFIGPDNGIFTPLLLSKNPLEIFSVENAKLFLKRVSNTFHGRDIIAPVAARLASGMAIAQVGPKVKKESCILVSLKEPVLQPNGVAGEVTSIDHFGNVRTNITKSYLNRIVMNDTPCITIKNYSIDFANGSYSSMPDNIPTALVNSSGELEISIKNGNAGKKLQVSRGERVFVRGHLPECISPDKLFPIQDPSRSSN